VIVVESQLLQWPIQQKTAEKLCRLSDRRDQLLRQVSGAKYESFLLFFLFSAAPPSVAKYLDILAICNFIPRGGSERNTNPSNALVL
jgi:hypothetical protein